MFLLQEVRKRDPEWIEFRVRYYLSVTVQWVLSACSVILGCFVEDFRVKVPFDDVLIITDKTEFV